MFADDGVHVLGRVLEGAVNRALHLDPEALRRLGELEGRVLLIELGAEGAPPLRVFVLPSASGVRLRSAHDQAPDVTISGTPAVFLNQLARGPAVSDALTVRGDIELGRRFQRVLARLDPDWEEGLAAVVGDIPAHQLGRLARGFRGWLEGALRTLGDDAAEYLKEESFVLAKRERVEEFLRGVDRLRADADRLEKRVQRLASRV